MSLISHKPPLKDDYSNLNEERVTSIKFAIKFILLFVICLTILAPWLEALLIQMKG